MKYIIATLILLCVFSHQQAFSDTAEPTSHLLRGRVLGADTNQPLPNASITVLMTNVSTVTNQEGYFSIRVPGESHGSQLIIRHLGYENRAISVASLIEQPNNHIALTPTSFELSEIYVLAGDGTDLVREALRRIPRNFPNEPNMMVAFYRESIRRGSGNFVSLVEAVLDVHKASYTSFQNDQARIYIGRRATDISPRDTLLLRFQGGITGALMLDIAKHPEIVFFNQGEEYNFEINGLISINDKPHYIISFTPRAGIEDIIFRGTIFLDVESLAFARMEFYMNVEGRPDASNIFIRRKPSRMEVVMERARYTVDFIEDNGTWFFNYSSMDIDFRVRWRNRFFGLFARNFSIRSEIAITDRYSDDVVRFPRNERIRTTDVIAERVEHFQDPYFWGEYTVIEPEQEITEAIRRLSGRLQRRSSR
jgi:hypothetical protein